MVSHNNGLHAQIPSLQKGHIQWKETDLRQYLRKGIAELRSRRDLQVLCKFGPYSEVRAKKKSFDYKPSSNYAQTPF